MKLNENVTKTTGYRLWHRSWPIHQKYHSSIAFVKGLTLSHSIVIYGWRRCTLVVSKSSEICFCLLSNGKMASGVCMELPKTFQVNLKWHYICPCICLSCYVSVINTPVFESSNGMLIFLDFQAFSQIKSNKNVLKIACFHLWHKSRVNMQRCASLNAFVSMALHHRVG